MGRRPNTDLRREQIVGALLKEMVGTGYERATIRSIASGAGLAPGLVHYHFKSKHEILLAVVDRLIATADLRFAEIFESPRPPAERLAAYVGSRVGLGASADPAEVKAWVGVMAEALGQPKVRTRVAKWLRQDHQRLSQLFADAKATSPDEKAAALLAMILGSFSLFSIHVAGIPKGYAEPQMLEWLRLSLPKQN